MQAPASEQHCVQFGAFTVDLVSRELWKDVQKLPLQERPFQILAILLERRGELVTRDELRQRLWSPDTFVDFEHSINTAINKLRETLGDSGDHPRFIETLPRRGYRFIAPIEFLEHAPPAPVSEPLPDLPPKNSTGPQLVSPRTDVDLTPAFRQKPEFRANALRRYRMLLAAILTLVVAAVGFDIWRKQARHADDPGSVAVLPFADLSPNHDQEYFSEGLSEEILNALTRIPDLRVVARTSAFQFKGKNEDSRVIGKKLNVTNLLEGSVRRDGNHVRITVQLIDARNGYHVWSESFDRDAKDILSIEEEIAKSVCAAVSPNFHAAIGSGAPIAKTTSPEAYEAFLQARYFAHMQDADSGHKAIAYATKAIQLDPDYAAAYALRAGVEVQAGGLLWIDSAKSIDAARQDAERSLALDPNLGDGYRVLSQIQASIDSNCRIAETSLRKAVELDPHDPDNLGSSAILSMCQGRLEEAVIGFRRELQLDPLRPMEYLFLAQALRDLGRYDEANAALTKALDIDANGTSMIHEVAGEILLLQGRPQEALIEMQKEPAGIYRDTGEALAYHALGRRRDSDAALARLLAEHSNDGAYQIAQVYGYRGEVDEAFRWLDRARAQHDTGLLWVKTDLKLNSLRNDPRYPELMKQLNLPVGQT